MKISKKFLIAIYYLVIKNIPHAYFSKSTNIRSIIVKQILKEKCGINIKIQENINFGNFLDVKLGNNIQINEDCKIRNVIIGNHVMIAPNVYFLHTGHNYSNLIIPMIQQGKSYFPPTIVEDDVWIGACVLILPGRRIGKGSILAAGSVIVKDVEPYTIVGGNPAKFIKKRT